MSIISIPSGFPASDDEAAIREVAAVVRVLPTMAIERLAQGPTPEGGERACRVCEVLGGDAHPACTWLLRWHGANAVRCGIIYGLAAAARFPAEKQ